MYIKYHELLFCGTVGSSGAFVIQFIIWSIAFINLFEMQIAAKQVSSCSCGSQTVGAKGQMEMGFLGTDSFGLPRDP